LALDSGRLAIAGRVGRSLDLAVSAKSLPLAAAALAAPRLGLSGILNGRVHVFGVPPALSGAWSVTATGVSSASMRSANLPPIKVSAQGDLARGGARFSGSLAAGAGALIHVAGFAPFTGRGLDLSAKGSLDAALAARVLPDGEKLAGKIGLDVRATGSLKKPRFAGSAALSAGSFADAASGLRLSDLAAQLVAKGDHLRLVRLTGETPAGGSVSVSGRVELKAGFPGQVQIAAHHARLLANEFGTATVNLSLEASGPLAQRPRLRGRVDILTMELAVPDQLPHALRPLPNLRMLHPNRAAAARLALAAKRKARAAQRLPFDADIDLDISAANRIFVRGRGLDAEFAGQIGLTGSLSQPIARGAFDLRRGRLDFLTKRLDLSSGRLAFAGGLIPRLDIAAQTTSGGITAQISVTGPANKPVFAFSSTPALPQDEILSRILFAKPSGGLSPFEALQLADFASRLAGGSDGSGAFDKIRKSLGVDSLDVRSDAAGNAQVGASRYINDRMSLGVTTGAKPQDSAVSLGVDVTKRLRAQGQIGADGSSSVGLGMEWNY
ncbi:MAG TPA: translocation/assembly module TamB domain-containing protein, partial [Beijerinckiaceae bacterium]|nr:translocation/assembly module TamB domain-containing protein [Beijerinckiaceae bacterium]